MRDLYWMMFISFIFVSCLNYYEEEQLNKGKSISAFLAYYHDIDVLAAEARWMIPVVTTYNITLEELDVIMPYGVKPYEEIKR